VTIDGVTSSAFTLTVNAPLVKSVSIGSQTGTLTVKRRVKGGHY
jgi:hypothetical protein